MATEKGRLFVSIAAVLTIFAVGWLLSAGAEDLTRIKFQRSAGHYPIQRLVVEVGPSGAVIPGTASCGNYLVFARPLLNNTGPMLQAATMKAYPASAAVSVTHVSFPDNLSRQFTLSWPTGRPKISFPASLTAIVTVIGE